MEFGVASVVGITVIAYLIGMGCKTADSLDDKYIPVICGVSGVILGIVGMYTMPDYPAHDIINAMAIGAASGLAATGVNQIGKQLSRG